MLCYVKCLCYCDIILFGFWQNWLITLWFILPLSVLYNPVYFVCKVTKNSKSVPLKWLNITYIIYTIWSTLCDVSGFVVLPVEHIGHVIVLRDFRPSHGIDLRPRDLRPRVQPFRKLPPLRPPPSSLPPTRPPPTRLPPLCLLPGIFGGLDLKCQIILIIK